MTTTPVHPASPAGETREHPVTCGCGVPTWNHCGLCDRHCHHGPDGSRAARQSVDADRALAWAEGASPAVVALTVTRLMQAHDLVHALHVVRDGACVHCSLLTGVRMLAPCPTLSAAAIPAECCRVMEAAAT